MLYRLADDIYRIAGCTACFGMRKALCGLLQLQTALQPPAFTFGDLHLRPPSTHHRHPQPPAKLQRQWGEVLAHSVEAVILMAGLLMLFFPANINLAKLLVGCYFLDLALMLLPDLLRYFLMAARAAWRWAARRGGGGGRG